MGASNSLDHLQKSWSDPKDSGGQGFKDSSEMLKIRITKI